MIIIKIIMKIIVIKMIINYQMLKIKMIIIIKKKKKKNF